MTTREQLGWAFRIFAGKPLTDKALEFLGDTDDPAVIRRRMMQKPNLFPGGREMRLAGEIAAIRDAVRSGKPIRIVVAAANTRYPGWVSTNRDLLDRLRPATWTPWLKEGSVTAILAEHFWEHLSGNT